MPENNVKDFVLVSLLYAFSCNFISLSVQVKEIVLADFEKLIFLVIKILENLPPVLKIPGFSANSGKWHL